jgi:hypothetical protein
MTGCILIVACGCTMGPRLLTLGGRRQAEIERRRTVRVNIANFGLVNSTYDPRILQLAGKLYW